MMWKKHRKAFTQKDIFSKKKRYIELLLVAQI